MVSQYDVVLVPQDEGGFIVTVPEPARCRH
jgi:hypothetical protein